MNFLKFNIYSLLLTFISILLSAAAIFCGLAFSWYLAVIFAGGALFCLHKAADIFRRYTYKVKVFKLLTEKLRNKYDLRYCRPYMNSACMRSVVYFALCEVGKRKDYRTLKNHPPPDSDWQRIISVNSVNGKLQFTAQDIITGEREEI